MFLSLKTGAALEPISLAQAKNHLRVDGGDEDELISSLITAARMMVEAHTDRALLDQIWIFHFKPKAGFCELPLQPISNILSVEADGQTLASSDYQIEERGEAMAVRLDKGENAKIEFVAGYGNQSSSVPKPLLQAILQLTAHWFENRGQPSLIGSHQPKAVLALLAPYRKVRL